ncbi:hypothetical protein [Novipirellula rosea]|uniref:Uncharacterized protein n=1 Tax=Novipirellula rosea TaxID=1031540 RepID=A0ABP8MV75_9BACT
MTTIVYNGVELRDCETLAFDQVVEYDESKTDVLYSRFRIRVASTLVALRERTTSEIADGTNRQFGIETVQGQTVVQRAHDIHARLSESRKDFWMLVDNCVTDEKKPVGAGASVLDQPLLIATGKAWDEEIVTDTIGNVGGYTEHKRIERTELFMVPHPFSENSDTNAYGPGDGLISKSNVLDCDNGPKPLSVKVNKIIGGRSLRVEFEIEVCRPICNPSFADSEPIVFGGEITSSGNQVLSNRWSIEESKDDNWITTRSLQGTLRVAHSSVWPHAMRWLCMPALMKGYKRIRQSYVDDATNLVLKYRIDDQQAHAAPPYPAIKWSGHHAETATGSGGVLQGGEFAIRLTGPPGVDKQQLIAAAGKVAVNRIRGLGRRYADGGDKAYDLTLRNASIVDVLHEPTIEMRVQVSYVSSKFKFLALRVKEMGRPLNTLDGHEYGYDPELDPYLIAGYNPRVWPVPLAYDSETPAGLFNCYLQHPCSVWHDMPGGLAPADEIDTPERKEKKESGQPDNPYPADQYTEQEVPEDDTYLSEDTEIYDYPYTFIELQNRYRINNGWAQIPIANTDPNATKTAELIKLHGRTAARVLTMTATRDGKPPMLPSMNEDQVDQNGCREVLDRIDIVAKAPQLMADGTGRRFEMMSEYVYLMERAPRPNEKLRGASSPLDLFSPDSNSLDLSEIVDTGGHLVWENGVTTTYPLPSS